VENKLVDEARFVQGSRHRLIVKTLPESLTHTIESHSNAYSSPVFVP
jgi:hypothetical protein